jgi:hypothetical protein
MREAQEERNSIPFAEDTARWKRDLIRLPFVCGGVALFTVRCTGLILDVPFNQATSDPTQPPPPPGFPEDIEATRIFACPLLSPTRRIALLPEAIRYIPAQYDHLYIEINGAFDQYLAKFSSKTRWTFRKKLKRFLASAGADVFREYHGVPDMQAFLALSSAVSRKTFQQRLLDAGIPQDKTFPIELAQRAASGQVYGYILLHKDVPAAYALCYAHGDTLTLDKMGFDPQFSRVNAGTVLTYLLIERLFAAQRFRVFDFGSGHYEYKALFATHSIRCADVMHLRRTVRNLAVVSAHAGLELVSEGLKNLLDVVGLKARLRRLLHRGL